MCVGGWGWGWGWGGWGGSLNPFSPPACPHPVFSRAACESSQRAEGPSCLPLPPPSSSAFPSLNPPLPVSRPSSKPGAAISRHAFLSPFPWPHTGFQAESFTPTRRSPIDHFLSEWGFGLACLELQLNARNDTFRETIVRITQCVLSMLKLHPALPFTF